MQKNGIQEISFCAEEIRLKVGHIRKNSKHETEVYTDYRYFEKGNYVIKMHDDLGSEICQL